MIEARLPDGTVLRFPEGTADAVIDRVVKEQMGLPVEQPAQTATPVESAEPLAVPFSGDPGTEVTEALPLPEGALERDTAQSLLASVGPRFNEGIANLAGAPVDIVNATLSAIGVPTSDMPIGGSESIRAGLEGLGVATGEEGQQRLLGRDPTLLERGVGRVSQELGAAAPAMVPGFAVARTAAPLTAPRTTAQALGRAVVDPIRQAPGRVAVADVGLAAGSGAGAAAAQEIAPGSTGAELTGQFAPFLVAPTLAGGVRLALRGQGTQRMQDAIDAFRSAGTAPTVGQATQRPSIQRLENTLGRLPGSSGRMQTAAAETAEAIGNRVNNIADNLATNVDPEQAGRIVTRGLVSDGDSFSTRFRDVSNRLYTRLDQQIPRQQSVEVTNTTRVLDDLTTPVAGAENVSESLINPQLRVIAERFRADAGDTGALPYEALAGLRSLIGRRLSGFSVQDDLPRAELNRLYGAISSDIEAAARQQGPAATRAFERANSFYSSGMDRIENVIQPLVRRGVPEQVFTALERSGKEGATTLRRIMRSLKPEEQAAVSSLVLRRLGRAPAGQQGAEGDTFSVSTFLTNWNRNLSPQAKSALFGRNPHMRQDLDRIAEASELIRNSIQAGANPSGSGGAVMQALGPGAVVAGLGDLGFRGDPTLLASVLAAFTGFRGGAELITSPKFVRWLARSGSLPAREIPVHISRLTNTLQGSDQAAEALELLSAAIGGENAEGP